MISITNPWPFAQWGIDIKGPFLKAPGKVKNFVIAVDCFLKWVEVDLLAIIIG